MVSSRGFLPVRGAAGPARTGVSPQGRDTFARLAAGYGIGGTTAWRYVNETVELLAARAPKLRQAVRDAKKAGHAYVILDGALIPVDRVAADKLRCCPWRAGKLAKAIHVLQIREA